MRIAYDASSELRVWKGTEKDKGYKTDLYGVKNMFTYNRDGTTLQRVRKRWTIGDEEDEPLIYVPTSTDDTRVNSQPRRVKSHR